MPGYNCFTGNGDKIKNRSKSRKDTLPKTPSRKMVKWWYGTGLKSSQEDKRRQQQQFDTEARMGSAQSVNPPSYESMTHQVDATGGIQINHTGKGTRVIAGIQHVYVESAPESSVTEDFEGNNAATEDSGWETEDTGDAISKQKKSEQEREKASEKEASHPSPESTPRQLKTSVGIQNNNAGNGAQYNTFASQGNVYTFNSAGGTQIQEAVFHGDMFFGSGGGIVIREACIGNGHRHNQSSYAVRSGVQNNNTENGTQFNTFSSQGNVYNFNSGGGRQFQHAEFHGDLRFGPDNETTVTSNNRGNGQSSYVVQNKNYNYGTGAIITGGVNTGATITIDGQGVHVHNTEPQGQKKEKQQHEKKSQESASPSDEHKLPHFEASGAIQNNNMGIGTQFNTFSSRYINTGTGSQFHEAHFYGNGNVEFRKHDKANYMAGKHDTDANSEVSTDSEDAYRPYSGTGNIHVQNPETGADVRISASGIRVKGEDGREVHIQN